MHALSRFTRFHSFLLLFRRNISLITSAFHDRARINFRSLAGIRAEQCTRQIRCSICQDAIFVMERVFSQISLEGCALIAVATYRLIAELSATFGHRVCLGGLRRTQYRVITLNSFTTFHFRFLLRLIFRFIVLLDRLFRLVLFLFINRTRLRPTVTQRFIRLLDFGTANCRRDASATRRAHFRSLRFFERIFLHLFRLRFFSFRHAFIFFCTVTDGSLGISGHAKCAI